MHSMRRLRRRKRKAGVGVLHAALGGNHGVDANQAEIIDALLAQGASVQVLAAVGGGCPDLLVGYCGQDFLLEVKDGAKEPRKRRLRPNQAEWHSTWKGRRPRTVESPAQALLAIGAIRLV